MVPRSGFQQQVTNIHHVHCKKLTKEALSWVAFGERHRQKWRTTSESENKYNGRSKRQKKFWNGEDLSGKTYDYSVDN